MRVLAVGATVLAGCLALGAARAGASGPTAPVAGQTQLMDDLGLAYEALDAHDFERAADLFRKVGEAAQSEELRYGAALGLGSALAALGRHEQAAAALEQAVALRPDDPAALLNLGETYRDLGRNEEAVTVLERAVAAKSDLAEAYLALAVVQSRLGRHVEAGKAAAKAVDLQPKNPRAHLSLAVALYHATHYEPAARSFEKALQLDPGNPGALYGLGLCRLYLKDLDGAKTQLELLRPVDARLAADLEERMSPQPEASPTRAPGFEGAEQPPAPTPTPPP